MIRYYMLLDETQEFTNPKHALFFLQRTNFRDFLSYVINILEEDEDFLTDEQKEQFNFLLTQDKNILEFLTNCYWNLRHPEYYNIFYSYDDCFTILEDAVKQKEPF